MSSADLFTSEITIFGEQKTIACDAKCNKAFGINGRPTSPNSLDENDWEWLADDEVDEAPGTGETAIISEGDDYKPGDLLEAHNRWCARECERSVIVKIGETAVLLDFDQRVSNITR